ncbi:NUDIX domain-containing protein, partial [Candidatus Saccharibacteria bacterium]|nr:NUDIX domain-containing protein [Candidatus Saccharibacteria bacterium]
MARTKVILCLIEKGGKFLLIRRKLPSFGVEWAFPGGVMDEGETEAKCALREAQEEVKLDVEVKEKLLERKHPNTFVNVSYFHCTPKGSAVAKVGQDHEIAEVEWVPASEVLGRFTSDVHPTIEKFILS